MATATDCVLKFPITHKLEVDLSIASAVKGDGGTDQQEVLSHEDYLDMIDAPAVVWRQQDCPDPDLRDNRFAFVFDITSAQASGHTGLGPSAHLQKLALARGPEMVSPLDVVYLARLCVLEEEGERDAKIKASCPKGEPPHISRAGMIWDTLV